MAVIWTKYGGMSVRDKSFFGSSGGGSSSSNKGTYYEGSGTYIDSSGAGFSMKKAPKGAKIVSGIDPNLQRQRDEVIRQEEIRKESERQEAIRKESERRKSEEDSRIERQTINPQSRLGGEVIRRGETMSVGEIRPGDVVLKSFDEKPSYKIPSDEEKKTFESGTKIDTKEEGIFVHKPGTIYQVNVGEEESKGSIIPITKTYFVEGDYSSRSATTEESKQLKDYISAKQYEEVALSEKPSKFKMFYEEKKGQYKEFAAEPFFESEGLQDLFSKGGKVGEFSYGAISEAIGTKGELIKTGVIIGVTAGAGFAIRAATKLTTYGVTKVLGSSAGAIFGSGIKVGTYATGAIFTGKYLGGKATEFYYAEGAESKGRIFGRTSVDVGAGLIGFKLGMKGYDKLEGWYRTRGRSYIEIKQGEYPAAATSKQLEMFKKNIIKEFGEEPGAFHTTSKVFWKDGKIIPQPGTSELPGLYASTQISTPFSKISGSGGSSRIIPNLNDIFSPPIKPGVAFIKPKGFGSGKFTWSSLKQFEGQKFVKGKGYASWTTSTTEGTAYVPGLKTEIEAVFRPDSGAYVFESGKYYTTIKGVRVPIDVFKYSSETINVGAISSTPKTFKSESYSSYTSSPLVNPSAGVSSVISKVYVSSFSSASPSSISQNYSSPSSSSSRSSYERYFGESSAISKAYSKLSSYSLPSSKTSSSSSSSRSSDSTNFGSSSSIFPNLPTFPTFQNFFKKFQPFKQSGKIKSELFPQPKQYQPTLTAAAFNIKAPKISKAYKAGAGALTLRPLIKSGGRRR